MNFFDTIIYQPLFNVLILFYQNFGRDLGVATIMLAAFIKLATYPLMADSVRTQATLRRLQPKIDEINEKYKNDKEKKNLLQFGLLQENKINIFSGFLLIIVQIAIIPPLYRIFKDGFAVEKLNEVLYGFVSHQEVSAMFLGLFDISTALPVFAIIAGVTQFIQMKVMASITPKPAAGQGGQLAQMMQSPVIYYVFPAMAVAFFWGLPAVISLYWAAVSVFSVAEQYIILKKIKQ